MGLVERLSAMLEMSTDTMLRVAATFGVFVAWLIARWLSRRLLTSAVEDTAARFQMRRVVGYLIGGTCFVLGARLWIQGISGFATYLGLVSAGVAIALQDLITNLAGWLFILVRRPFRIGDRIQVGGHAGDVVDIRPFRFIMLEIGNWVHADQSTGRILHIPNGWVFKNSIANYDEAFGYIWNEIEIVVTFESDWRLAKKTLEDIVNGQAEQLDAQVRKRIDEAAETMHLKFSKLTPVVWTSVVDSGVRLTMRYLCKPRERRSSMTIIWEKVLDAFAAYPNVDFAYPTTRRFDNAREGKVEARAPMSQNRAEVRHAEDDAKSA